jgi:peptidyl-prolyl cis-trans isomerase A (cyclophilin A)
VRGVKDASPLPRLAAAPRAAAVVVWLALAPAFAFSLAPSLAACGSGPTTPVAVPGAGQGGPTASATPPPPAESIAQGEPAPSAAPGSSAAPAASGAPVAEAIHHDPAQLEPGLATARAPGVFHARFMTTRGVFVVEVHRDWAPNGADRFYNLVKMGFFDDTRFFRVIDGFMAQFGISGDPRVAAMWRSSNIQDDPVAQSNKRGRITFAQTSEPNSRSTQVFINFGDNGQLDAARFAPFGEVVQGMGVVDSLYKGYGEGKPAGKGPDQGRIQEAGNRYLDDEYPQLDRVLFAQIF